MDYSNNSINSSQNYMLVDVELAQIRCQIEASLEEVKLVGQTKNECIRQELNGPSFRHTSQK